MLDSSTIGKRMMMTKKLFGGLFVFLATSLMVASCFVEDDLAAVLGGNPMGAYSGKATGEAPGYDGAPVKVTVTLGYGYIDGVDMDVSTQSDTEGYAGPMVRRLTPMIIKANSFNIDAVCGATYTARAVKIAGNKALYEITQGEYGKE
jgi:uncharacterized protein with FMN-binding domain